jgi:hypothetical protein
MKDNKIKALIDAWEISETFDVSEMYESFKVFIDSYQHESDLDTKCIIKIIKDLRLFLNPTKDNSIFYFTDCICDNILLKFENIDKTNITKLFSFIDECEVYSKSKL